MDEKHLVLYSTQKLSFDVWLPLFILKKCYILNPKCTDMATFGRAKGFKLYSRLLLTLCAHKSDHNCRLMAPNEENKILHILTMDVGESHIKKFIFGDLSIMLTILTYL